MTVISSRTAMKFPVGSTLPPVHVRAVVDPKTGQLYHRDDFDCFTRTGDQVVFDWPELNHTDRGNLLGGPRWVGIAVEEVVEFTREECLFEDVVRHLKALEADLTAMLDLEVRTAPIGVLAMAASAQREIRQCAKLMGIKLDV